MRLTCPGRMQTMALIRAASGFLSDNSVPVPRSIPEQSPILSIINSIPFLLPAAIASWGLSLHPLPQRARDWFRRPACRCARLTGANRMVDRGSTAYSRAEVSLAQAFAVARSHVGEARWQFPNCTERGDRHESQRLSVAGLMTGPAWHIAAPLGGGLSRLRPSPG
jgi:hypothetical protein